MRNYKPNDVWLYHMIVAMPGITVAASEVGAVTTAVTRENTPEVLMALGSANVCDLAGFLVPMHLNR